MPPECDGPLVLATWLCKGRVVRYRREAHSFGVPFMTSATLCAKCRARLPFWQKAKQVAA
jgi:hypothetical protein